jgi:hydrogenase expression/formation protein HypE
MISAPSLQNRVCPMPHNDDERIQLGHGSGGKMSAQLLRDRFLPRFGSAHLRALGDGALVPVEGGEIVISTDTFVVSPLEFPGGNIGHLAIHGTVNDLAMMGATPRYLSVGFVLEEGLELPVLDRILDRPGPDRAEPGDVVIVSGPVARHGMAIMAVREGLSFEADIESDTASLAPLVASMREAAGPAVHALRDATRGGLASTLNEIAAASGVGVMLEGPPPVPAPVEAACEMLGLDPLYVANEGVLVAFVSPEAEQDVLAALRGHPVGIGAACIGVVTDEHPGTVAMRTALGGTRVVDMLPGDQLPRIC